MAFANKVVLITGASSGIGAGCAEHFAKEGALLSLVGRSAEKFQTVWEALRSLGVENEPLIIIADVTVDFERIITKTIERYQRIDVLINNAGFVVTGTIDDIKIEDYDAMMATNTRALLQLTQCAVPHLVATKGNIINISSVGAISAFTNFLGYCMSKAAVDQFTRCCALELADRGVRVNCVNPGFIDTPFHLTAGVSNAEEYPAFLEAMATQHPIGRNGYLSDTASAIAFLADERNSFVTGVCLPVDGALSIKSPFS